MRPKLNDITGLHVYASSPKTFAGGSDNASVQLVIKSNKEYGDLKKVTNRMMAAMEYFGAQSRLFTQIRGEVGSESQDFAVKIDRERLAALNIDGQFGTDPDTIARTIEALIGGRVSTHFRIDNRQYDVKIEVADNQRRSPQDISGLFIKGAKGAMVPLDDVVDIVPRIAPIEINHFNKMRSLSVYAELADGASQGEAVDLIKQISSKVLTDDMRMEFAGQTREFLNESTSMMLIFALALAFIFLVLAAQFESFIDPLIIMLSVPLSITGGIIALKIAPVGSINLFSQIGMITLIGLITKHGILIVDFANNLRDQGRDVVEAVIEAAYLRLRPILMTTFAMVLGAIPLAFAHGPGAESRQQIGIVIVGGMTFGTLLTLFIVPAIYTYLTRKNRQPLHESE
jgi:multidrug efflux pump